ncbi:MAG: family 78 glycoside hydrolase catalytic domain [bacterium]|nr:family 78 glycoside hydrolase catalytic domain [bacterium]
MITNAEWISSPIDIGEVCPTFSKDIKVSKSVKKSELRISATGVYDARINDKRVGDFILAPGLTSYKSRLQYQTYDVTDMLENENVLSICLGKGWYRGRISANDKSINETDGAVIAELVITYNDGSAESVITNNSWNVSTSCILFSDIYDGETYDASAEIKELGNAVINNSISKSTLIEQEGEIVKEQEKIKPVRMFTTPKGECVIDFGQNIAGYVDLDLTADKGDKIVISHAEVLDSDGNFYNENYRSAKAKFEYICCDGHQTYKPYFTYFGFQYIRLDECPSNINLDNFTAIAIYSDMKRTGYIETGSKKVNKLFENTLWSQRDNFIDIPTDCPQRDERMGWLGDAQVFAKTASYNYNTKKFFSKWLGDLRAEQRENGSVPDTVPNFWLLSRSSTAWGDAMTVIPWQMYLMYGDKKDLEVNFDAMKRWVDFMTNDSLDKYLWTCADDSDKMWRKHYGDWLALDAPSGSYRGITSDNFIASAFYAYSTEILIKAGKVIGKDMFEYEELHKNIVSTFKKTFTEYFTQTECVLALYFNLTDNKEETAKQLNDMIVSNGNKLQTGFVGTPYLLYALSENGYAKTAYSLLLQEEYPSWLYEVNHGATTIWEHWDGIRDDGTFWSTDMNSYNHYAYGSVVDWLYSVAAGIKPVEEKAGFKEVVIAPVPDERLGSINVSFDTAYGTIKSAWHYEGDKVYYEITTPVKATIIIDGEKHLLESRTYIFK